MAPRHCDDYFAKLVIGHEDKIAWLESRLEVLRVEKNNIENNWKAHREFVNSYKDDDHANS